MFKFQTKQIAYILFLIINFSINIYSQKEISDSDTYFSKAKEVALKKDFVQATKYCELALDLAPLDQDIKEYLGKCYMEIGAFEKARITLLEVLKKSPKRVDARHYLLNIETQSKRYSSAVCYANELLEITPYSKTLWIKKINLYNFMKNKVEANRAANRLFQIFPNDKEVRYIRANFLKDSALEMSKGNELITSAKQYEDALKISSKDADTYLKLINIYLKLGNNVKALEIANRGLNMLPKNRKIINKKIGILEKEHKYQEAINLIKNQKKKKGRVSGHYNKLQNHLLSEAARYQKNLDPYELYGKLYYRNKKNKTAFNYLLNTSISRGYYADSEQLLQEKLKTNPTSKELLSKQLFVYEAQNKKKQSVTTLNKLYTLYPNDYDIKEKYDSYIFEEAKRKLKEKNYKEAQKIFLKFKNHSEYAHIAKQHIYTIYIAEQKYDKAENLIEKLILEYPTETKFKLRKIDLYAIMGNYEEAFELANIYASKYPKEHDYKNKIKDLSIDYIKNAAKTESWDTVKFVADNLIKQDSTNYLGYNYAIGARISMGQNTEAQTLIKSALKIFPNSRKLKLKLAGSYSTEGNFKKAIEKLQSLQMQYPYSSTIKGALTEEMLKKGQYLDENKQNLEAIKVYKDILKINPKNTIAAIRYTNDLILLERYTDAMEIADQSLQLNKGNLDLIYKKGIIYEKMEDYENALKYQKEYVPPYNKLKTHNNYLGYLESRLLKNQVNVSYLNAVNDSTQFATSITTFEYLRLAKKNTYITRLNYAGRANGVGIQGEFDWTHKFSNKSYSSVNIGASTKHFAKYQLGITYSKPFLKVWLAEIGAKHIKTRGNINFYTAHLGMERSYRNIWINLKIFGMTDGEDYFDNVLLQSRFYMKNEKDYLLTMASVGSAPENEKLDLQINSFLFYTNSMIGAGYYHYFNHRTSIGLLANWFNYRVNEKRFLNQFNLYLTLRTKF